MKTKRIGFVKNLMVLAVTVVMNTVIAYGDTGMWIQWHNSLKPVGQSTAPITLARDGRAEYGIVLPDQCTSQEQKAADDLAYYLQEMTGAAFDIISDSEKSRGKEISIGKTNRLSAAKLSVAEEDLGDEGYAIAVKEDNLFLLGGRKRGPIYAVYALLEEDLGCRWYAGRTSHIPHQPTLTFSPVPRHFVPVLKVRDPYYQVAFDGWWSLRNRTNANLAPLPEDWGGHIDYALFLHSVSFLVPSSQYFDDHPEYFQLNKNGKREHGQLCMTNPDTIRIATQNVRRLLKENPHSEMISISKSDGQAFCSCDACKALDDAEGTNMASLLHFVNAIAQNIEQEHPNVHVSTLAYLETKEPPKTIRPRKNVVIRFCLDEQAWANPFSPAKNCQNTCRQLARWNAICDHVSIWDYAVNFSHYLAPMPNMDVLADNIRFFIDNGAESILEQGCYQSPGGERDLMRAWVLAKLMWDPSRDVWHLMQDFIWGYFGKAAPAIAQYNALLRQTARDDRENLEKPLGIRYPMDAEYKFLSKDFIDQASALYDRAELLAENEEILRRVERDRLPIMYVQLERGPEFTGQDYPVICNRFAAIARREGMTLMWEMVNYVSEKSFGNFDALIKRDYSYSLEDKLRDWRENARKTIPHPQDKNAPVRIYPYCRWN